EYCVIAGDFLFDRRSPAAVIVRQADERRSGADGAAGRYVHGGDETGREGYYFHDPLLFDFSRYGHARPLRGRKDGGGFGLRLGGNLGGFRIAQSLPEDDQAQERHQEESERGKWPGEHEAPDRFQKLNGIS